MMIDEAVTAQSMAEAARRDPQFAVPVRPRVRRGVVVRRYPGELVVEGTPTRHVLGGSAAHELVPRLLPLLDGTRGHDELAADLETTTTVAFAAVSLLWTCGVVEEAAPPGIDVGWVPEPLADYLSRMGDSTAANAAWEQAAARLAGSRVRLHGEDALREALATQLAGSVAVHAGGDDPPGSGYDMVVLLETARCPAEPALVDECWRRGVPLLRIGLFGSELELGPYVHPAVTPCLSCLTDGDDRTGGEPLDPAIAAQQVQLAAGLAAGELFGLFSRATRVTVPMRWRRVGLDPLAQSSRSGATRPGCPRCSVAVAAPRPRRVPSLPRPAPLAARYEAAVALPPKEYADLKAHQAHYQPANIALQRGHRTWPVAPRWPLPAVDLDCLAGPATTSTPAPSAPAPGAPALGAPAPSTPAPSAPAADGDRPRSDGPTLAELALLLAIGAGWQAEQPERVWRWTASGGNIGSVMAHVLVRHVDGLLPGVYGYLPATHELALIRPDRDGCDCGGDACLLLTADLPRVSHKYHAFGLRIVLLDAGCAHTALLEVAQRLHFAAVADCDFDDRHLHRLLGTNPEAEPITGLIHLNPHTTGGKP